MSALRTLYDRPQLRAIAMLVLLLAALALGLAAVSPTAATVLALVALGSTGLLGLRVATARPRQAARPRRAAPDGELQPTLKLTLPGGETISARPVALGVASEGTLLLTRDGYMVVDSDGRVIHRM